MKLQWKNCYIRGLLPGVSPFFSSGSEGWHRGGVPDDDLFSYPRGTPVMTPEINGFKLV